MHRPDPTFLGHRARVLLATLCLQTLGHAQQPSSVPMSASAPATAAVRGLCVAEATGAPIAGAIVRLDGFEANDELVARHGPQAWTNPPPVQTGVDGRFEIRFVPPPSYQHGLLIEAAGCVPRTARWGPFKPGQVDDLGTIPFSPGYRVQGSVVDEEGRPVAKVGVSLGSLPLPIRGNMGASNSLGSFSDERGEFVFRGLVPAGSWPVTMNTSGLLQVEPDSLRVREGRGADPFVVKVKRMPSLSGVVVDQNGAPVEGVYLQALNEQRSEWASSSWTNAEGHFRLWAKAADPAPAWIEISEPGPCEPPPLDHTLFAWGKSDLRIVLRRARAFDLTVVEKATSKPVEAYAVQCYPVPSLNTQWEQLRLGDPHPEGKARVDRVFQGPHVLQVFPRDPALAKSGRLEIPTDAEPLAPIRVELERNDALAVRVAQKGGAPVVGATVEWIEPRGHAVVVSQTVYAEDEVKTSDPRGYQGPLVVARAKTDASGMVTLYGPRASRDALLRVKGAECAPRMLPLGEAPLVAGAREVVVQPGATLDVSVKPAGAYGASLQLLVTSGGHWLATLQRGPDQAFHARGLPAGEVTVVLQIGWGSSGVGDALGQDLALPGTERKLELEPAGAQSLELDVSTLAPAALDAIITVNGKPAPRARVKLRGTREGLRWEHGTYVPDPTGRIRASAIMPGSYEVLLWLEQGGAWDTKPRVSEQTIEVGPSQRAQREFVFKTP